MSDTAITVENLSKSYLVGHNAAGAERYTALRDVLARAARDLGRKTRDMIHGRPIIQGDTVKEFWALQDLSFEVKQGETLGIIGRNGAGKSTLLKILSRITEPTKGRVTINGRVASLLEVGTGFHPELTGRENIFLNGAILGMARGEIQRKFDEIVAFAEVEDFLDTPVKRYSSGMYVRLAFAVAAHMEPEILVVDEVLAVGDAAFQKKCLGKMDEVSKQGRTVLFVSHQMAMINTLCQRALLLSRGGVVDEGTTEQVVRRYLSSVSEAIKVRTQVDFAENPDLKGQILSAEVLKSGGEEFSQYDVFDRIVLKVKYLVRSPLRGVALNLIVKRNAEILFVSFDTDSRPELLETRPPGVYLASLQLPSPLKAGHYSMDIGLGVLNVDGVDVRRDALQFDIEEFSYDTSMRSYSSSRPGVVAVHLDWSSTRLPNSSSEI